MTHAKRRTREVDGLTMSWLEHGEGYPVVLVHGIPTGPNLWRHVLPRVEGARVLAWEMVGYASSISEGQGRDIFVACQAEYLARWLDAVGVEQAVFGGHDLGGGVVQIFAVRHPGRVAGILLTNAIGYDSWPIPSVKVLRALGGVVRRLPAGMVRTGIFGMLMARGHGDAAVTEESLRVHWGPYAEHGGGEPLIRQMRALNVNDTLRVAPELPGLRGVPARIVWGAADRFQKLQIGERFARDLNAPLDRIEGGKHFTPEDHPDRIAGALNDLVREARQRSVEDAAARTRGDAP